METEDSKMETDFQPPLLIPKLETDFQPPLLTPKLETDFQPPLLQHPKLETDFQLQPPPSIPKLETDFQLQPPPSNPKLETDFQLQPPSSIPKLETPGPDIEPQILNPQLQPSDLDLVESKLLTPLPPPLPLPQQPKTKTPGSGTGALYQCDFCSRSFKRKDRLEVHLKVHTGDRPYICGVPGCYSSYTRLQHLQRHIERVHFAQNTVESKLDCPHCTTLLANPECLKRHIQRFHSPTAQGKLFECPEEGCSEGFRKKSLLITHRERDHGSIHADRCHKCPYEGCNKTFPFPTVLRRHMKVHQGYGCDVEGCGGVFETYLKLRKHKAVEHGPDLVCRQCQAPFKSRQTLVQHLKTHLFVKEVFVCTEVGCERTFLYKKNLKQHIRAYHLGEKVFTRKKVPKDGVLAQKLPAPRIGVRKSSAGMICGVDDRGKNKQETPLDLSASCNDEQDENPSCSFEDILHKFYPPSEHTESSSDMDYESDPLQSVKSIIDESVRNIFHKKDSLSDNVTVTGQEQNADSSKCVPDKDMQVENSIAIHYPIKTEEEDYNNLSESAAEKYEHGKDNFSVYPPKETSPADYLSESIPLKAFNLPHNHNVSTTNLTQENESLPKYV